MSNPLRPTDRDATNVRERPPSNLARALYAIAPPVAPSLRARAPRMPGILNPSPWVWTETDAEGNHIIRDQLNYGTRIGFMNNRPVLLSLRDEPIETTRAYALRDLRDRLAQRTRDSSKRGITDTMADIFIGTGAGNAIRNRRERKQSGVADQLLGLIRSLESEGENVLATEYLTPYNMRTRAFYLPLGSPEAFSQQRR
jgi:hypothetical protein